jgi:hypothetical protein
MRKFLKGNASLLFTPVEFQDNYERWMKEKTDPQTFPHKVM